MDVTIEKKDNCVVINVIGRLDTTNFKTLEEQFLQLIAEGNLQLIVDCIKLDYVSSSGLRVFLVALKTLTKKQGKLFFCNLNEELTEIFEVSGFISIFNVVASKDAAFSECMA